MNFKNSFVAYFLCNNRTLLAQNKIIQSIAANKKLDFSLKTEKKADILKYKFVFRNLNHISVSRALTTEKKRISKPNN